MNPGRTKSGDDVLKEPKKKKVKPETILKDPYPIIFWNKLGIPPCNDLWPEYNGIFDGECVLVEDPEEMNEIYTMGYFGKRMLYRKGNEVNVGEIPVVRERQWKTRVEWAANFGYVLIPHGEATAKDSISQEDEDLRNISQVAKGENPIKDGHIWDSDRINHSSTTGEIAETSIVCNRFNSNGKNSHNSKIENKEDRRKNMECGKSGRDVEGDERTNYQKSIGGEDMHEEGERIFVRNDESEDISGEVNIKDSGIAKSDVMLVHKLKDEEEKKENILEDFRLRNKYNDKNDEKELESKKDNKLEVSNIIKTHENEKLGGVDEEDINYVQTDKRISKNCLSKLSEDSSEITVSDDAENNTDGHAESDGNKSKCHKAASEVSMTNLEGESKEEPMMGEKCPITRSTNGCTKTVGIESEEINGDDDEQKIKVELDKENGQSENKDEEINEKRSNTDLRKGELEEKSNFENSLNVKLDENEEQKDSDEVNPDVLKNGNMSNKSTGRGDYVCPNGEVFEDRKGKIECDNGNKEKQGVKVVKADSVRTRDKEGNPNPNDKALSLEIIDCDLAKHSANEEIVEQFDKQLKNNSLKRNIDIRSPIIEVREEIGSEGNVENDHSKTEYVAKKRRTTELVILDSKEDNKMPLDYIVNSNKEDTSEDGNLQEMENENNFVATSSPVDGSMLNESNDCEILEIKDEQTFENERASLLKPKFKEGSVRWLDSDEDIMEVSAEEVEMKENQNSARKKKGSIMSTMQTKDIEINRQNVSANNQMKSSRDIIIMDASRKETPLKGNDSNIVDVEKNKDTVDENEDDDIIEIDLQKSDMLDLEECIEDDSVDCEVYNNHDNFRRRIKESSGFLRKDRVVRHGDDDVMCDEVEEIEDKQSVIGRVKLESECDVSPCIVLPDSDSEDDNPPVQVCPRLECDPSVYLPSIDILRLLPEEAFFLAYALGCMQVWDGRNVEVYGEGVEAKLQVDEVNGDLVRGKSKSNEKVNLAEKVERDNSIALSSENIDFQSFSKPCKAGLSSDVNNTENLSKVRSESLERSSLESLHVKKKNDREKQSIHSSSISDKDSPSKSAKNTNDGVKHNSLRSHSKLPEHLIKKPSSSKLNNESDEIHLCSFDESMVNRGLVKKNQESSSSNCSLVARVQTEKSLNVKSSANVSDVQSINVFFGKKGGFKVNESTSINPNTKNKSDANTSQSRENGVTVDSNIAFIDLADSPPSRQWANREGWSSDDQDDIITMDCDNTMDEALDCKPSTNHLCNSTNANVKNCSEDPMSLLDLWNALRSSRTITSPFSIPFEISYAVYHHFRAKRWVVKPGLRFGGDFLLYKDGPPFYHASYLVIIDSSSYGEKSRLTWNTLAGRNRLAENVAKELMICRVEWPQTLAEEELRNPKCLSGLTVQEILVRRWISNKEREEGEEYASGKDEDFIPLEL